MKIIELTRKDLTDDKKNKALYDITIVDFKCESVTLYDMEQAFMVSFKDDNGMSRILKHRNGMSRILKHRNDYYLDY